jgi:restriction system protein
VALRGCPACGNQQQVADSAGAFRCASCQRDVWLIYCHKCHTGNWFYGSAAGAGALVFPCRNCRGRSSVQKSRLRELSSEAKRLERVAAAALRNVAMQQKAAAVHHSEARQAEVDKRNRDLQATLGRLRGALVGSLSESTAFGFSTLKTSPMLPSFVDPSPPDLPAPQLEEFLPATPRGLRAHMPGAKLKYDWEVKVAKAAYEEARQAYDKQQSHRQVIQASARTEYDKTVAHLERTARRHNNHVDELERNFKQGDSGAVVEYLTAVLARMTLPCDIDGRPRVAFSPESRQVAIELELPRIDVVPSVREYKYVRTRDEITKSAMPTAERSAIYTSLVSQLTLQTIHATLRSDAYGIIETVVLNGHVHTIDRRTGQKIHPCLVTVRTTRDRFSEIDLGQVDPIECLKGLNASISKNPSELVPVRPILEFNMVDPRFISESDVLSTLDTRPNLMDLTPSEFESLITNLFEKMGLETKLTQASRDGGVDCVAYDTRPILGGKVVIQAKRYKNTVGVSAVRDLFGTMQNEGATKGILVTTSGYGKASYEFANGKPLELIDGSNLLYLLHEHAEIDARIVMPEDWEDPSPSQ